jgi:hypothetical protein
MSDEEKPKKKRTPKKKAPKAPKPKRKPLIPKLNMGKLREFAKTTVHSLIRDKASGPEKHQLAVERLAQHIDDQMDFGDGAVGSIAEALDGPVARFLVGVLVKDAYDDLFRKHQ